MTVECPCGSGRSQSTCCEPYLNRTQSPPTAEALMRARYTAYAQHRIDFLLETFAPERQYLFDRETTLEWARRSRWKSLEIRHVHGGTPKDPGAEATVEFVAWYERDGRRCRHHEVAEFRRDAGVWYYVDGRFPSQSALLGAESRRLKGTGTRSSS